MNYVNNDFDWKYLVKIVLAMLLGAVVASLYVTLLPLLIVAVIAICIWEWYKERNM